MNNSSFQFSKLLPLYGTFNNKHIVNSNSQDQKRNNFRANHSKSDSQIGYDTHRRHNRRKHNNNANNRKSKSRKHKRRKLSNGNPNVYEHCRIADDNDPHILVSLVYQLVRDRSL